MPHCGLKLRTGSTRQRTRLRHQFIQLLSGFRQLRRLDLEDNYFPGCLEELLSALHKPLDFLSLNRCVIDADDLNYLSTSMHASSLKVIDLSYICGPVGSDDIQPEFLLECLPKFRNVNHLLITSNYISDADKLSSILHSLPNLIHLNAVSNLLSASSCLTVFEACACILSMRSIILAPAEKFDNELAVRAFKRQVAHILRSHNRKNILILCIPKT